MQIYNNASGCSSLEEVKEACPSDIFEVTHGERYFQIFPNPAKKSITIESSSNILLVTIFDQTGQKVLQDLSSTAIVDVSKLQPGLYFIEIRTDRGIFRKKLIIE